MLLDGPDGPEGRLVKPPSLEMGTSMSMSLPVPLPLSTFPGRRSVDVRNHVAIVGILEQQSKACSDCRKLAAIFEVVQPIFEIVHIPPEACSILPDPDQTSNQF